MAAAAAGGQGAGGALLVSASVEAVTAATAGQGTRSAALVSVGMGRQGAQGACRVQKVMVVAAAHSDF